MEPWARATWKSEVRNSSHASIVRTNQAIASQLLTFLTSSLVPLQRLNDSRVQRFNAIRRGRRFLSNFAVTVGFNRPNNRRDIDHGEEIDCDCTGGIGV